MDLKTQTTPIAISDRPIPLSETTLTMRCQDVQFNDVSVFSSSSSGHQPLFTTTSAGMASMTWRRKVHDAESGKHIFDLRHFITYSLKNEWTVETPTGRRIGVAKHSSLWTRTALDMIVQNEADKGNEVKVEVRPKDQAAITTVVLVDGALVAEIQMTEANPRKSGDLPRSVWRARVAGGADLALVVAIMFCRAELQHTWKE